MKMLSLHTVPNMCAIFALSLVSALSFAAEFEGEVGLGFQWFSNKSNGIDNAYRVNIDGYLDLKLTEEFLDGAGLLVVDSHFGADQHDPNKILYDFQDLSFTYYADDTQYSAGVMTEFWGVTESRHLVNVLNQSNNAENMDEEIRLGQPMIKVQFDRDWGSVSVYWLPIFRERVFAGKKSRLSTSLVIRDDSVVYESSKKRSHHDFALRYSHTFDMFDFGLSYFRGTDRAPLLLPKHLAQSKQVVLTPYYQQMSQIGLEAQITYDNFLGKLELTRRQSQYDGTTIAAVAGLEYTQVGVFDSSVDLGFLLEYLYDEREYSTPFANDAFVALRLSMNNIAQSNYLLGVYLDKETLNSAWRFEMNTRIQDGMTVNVEVQAFSDQKKYELFYDFRDDDYVKVETQWYF